jgi:NADPH:quinone reductase-like Zn-dependent oxidoreductase
MKATGGKGVHVVLNSLAGQHQQLGLEALAPSGRFLEIGKMDIYKYVLQRGMGTLGVQHGSRICPALIPPQTPNHYH